MRSGKIVVQDTIREEEDTNNENHQNLHTQANLRKARGK